MKRSYIHRRLSQSILALTAGVLMVGCTAEEEWNNNPSAQKLDIIPMVNDTKATARATEDILHEKTLSSLDFKLERKGTTSLKYDEHFTDAKEGELKVLGDWRNDLKLDENQVYSYYAIANAKENYKGKSSADILNATQEDDDIWQTYTENNKKKFLMSCQGDYSITSESNQTIPVQLVRAAAKIQLNLTTAVQGFKATSVKWKLINYNTNTTVFAGKEATPKIVKDDKSDPSNIANGTTDSTYCITTYSYATQWQDSVDAPHIIVTIVFHPETGGNDVTKQYNIPVRDPEGDGKTLDRKHVYTINAKFKNLGTNKEIHYGDSNPWVYAITKWSDGGTTTINAGKPSFLVVSPTTLIMENVKEDRTSIRIVASAKCNVDYNRRTAYIYDANGNKITNNIQVGQTNIQYDNNVETEWGGRVEIESEIPQNGTVKVIRFFVYCGDKDNGTYHEQEVKVIQYPAEYDLNVEELEKKYQ